MTFVSAQEGTADTTVIFVTYKIWGCEAVCCRWHFGFDFGTDMGLRPPKVDVHGAIHETGRGRSEMSKGGRDLEREVEAEREVETERERSRLRRRGRD